jgi:hypothetical protein
MEYIPQSRARQDAYEELEAARIKSEHIGIMQEANRAIQVAAFCDSVSHISRRLDALEQRRTDRIRAEEEEREAAEQKAIEDALSSLPDPDAPHEWEAHPTGDLHDLPPSEPQHEQQLEATEGEHPDDNEGDLPNELTEKVPPITGTDPEFPGAREPEARNPVGISLT